MRFDWEPRGERRKLKARVSVLASELIELMPPAGIVLYSKLVTAGFSSLERTCTAQLKAETIRGDFYRV